MRPGYLVSFAIAVVASFVVAVTFHEFRSVDFALLSGAARAQDKILLFGNSVNRTISRCDRDPRTLPDMLSAEAGTPIVNLSRGGMPLSQMLRIAELSVSFGIQPKAVVFPVAFGDLLQLSDAPTGWDAFVRDNLPAALNPRPAERRVAPAPQDYKGRHYGSYNDFSKTHFEREKRESRCPEGLGTDPDFIEFMYWRTYLQPIDPAAGLARTIERAKRIQQHGVEVVFWFPPIDLEDLRALHGPQGVAAVRERVAALSKALSTQSFSILDTAEAVAAAGFTDRWCACGHLNEAGRILLARQMRGQLTQHLLSAEAAK